MVKKLLSVFAVSLLVSASAFAANVFEKPISGDVLNAKEATPAQVKEMLAKKAAKKAVAANDLVGYYNWTYYTSSTRAEDPTTIADRVEGSGPVHITVDGENVSIEGFNIAGANITLVGTVKNGQGIDYIECEPQVAYTDGTYGPCYVVSLWYDSEAGGYYYSKYVNFIINDDGSLEVEDYVYLRIDEGQYAGYRLGSFYSGNKLELDPTINGEMSVTYLQGKFTGTFTDAVYPVRLSQENNEVSVQNFMGHGLVAKITLNPDRTITIPKQLIWEGGDTMGDFYIYPADWSGSGNTVQSYITGEEIIGVGYDTELTWGESVSYSTNDYWSGPIESCSIKRIDDEKFNYGTVGVNDVNAVKNVAGVVYYNLAGVASATPFDGVNIEVVKYTDGTSKAVKVVK